jgi:hypothetical protein
MKELEQKALDLLYNHSIINPLHNDEEDIKHAIQSVNHTIDILEKLQKVFKRGYLCVNELLDEQIELKKILEGRL